MSPDTATTFVLDCGTMVGHEQHELEVPAVAVPFLRIPPGRTSTYISVRLSSGVTALFRAIFRPDNQMWRIELTTAVPEIAAGHIPAGTRRSDHAAIFEHIGGNTFNLRLVSLGSPDYTNAINAAAAINTHGITRALAAGGRNYGWF